MDKNTPTKISVEEGSLILIDVLFQQNIISSKTYSSIQQKYNKPKNNKITP